MCLFAIFYTLLLWCDVVVWVEYGMVFHHSFTHSLFFLCPFILLFLRGIDQHLSLHFLLIKVFPRAYRIPLHIAQGCIRTSDKPRWKCKVHKTTKNTKLLENFNWFFSHLRTHFLPTCYKCMVFFRNFLVLVTKSIIKSLKFKTIKNLNLCDFLASMKKAALFSKTICARVLINKLVLQLTILI